MEIVLQLTQEEKELIAPEMIDLARKRQAAKEAEALLARMLALRCPEFGRDPSVQFDAERGVFYRVADPQDVVEDVVEEG